MPPPRQENDWTLDTFCDGSTLLRGLRGFTSARLSDIIKDRHTHEDMLRGHGVGTYCSGRFPCSTHFFYERSLLSATRCIKFSSFKFVRHLGRDKMVSVFNVASCAPACLLSLRHASLRTHGRACPRLASSQYVPRSVPTLFQFWSNRAFSLTWQNLHIVMTTDFIRHIGVPSQTACCSSLPTPGTFCTTF